MIMGACNRFFWARPSQIPETAIAAVKIIVPGKAGEGHADRLVEPVDMVLGAAGA
jgi:hypothetical protein